MACAAAAHPVDLQARPTFADHDVVDLTVHSRRVSLAGVRISGDSLSGVPWRSAADPRVSYAVVDISNVNVHRAADAAGELAKSILLIGALVLLTIQLARGSIDN
jgi:hypothetical protein